MAVIIIKTYGSKNPWQQDIYRWWILPKASVNAEMSDAVAELRAVERGEATHFRLPAITGQSSKGVRRWR